MDSDDSIGRAFRKGRRVIKVPVNGTQKFEIKNITGEDVSLNASLHSLRFTIVNSWTPWYSEVNRFNVRIPPNKSLVFVIKDNGHVDWEKRKPTFFFEGVLIFRISQFST